MNLRGYETWKAFADAVAKSAIEEYARLQDQSVDDRFVAGADDDKVTVGKVTPFSD